MQSMHRLSGYSHWSCQLSPLSMFFQMGWGLVPVLTDWVPQVGPGQSNPQTENTEHDYQFWNSGASP